MLFRGRIPNRGILIDATQEIVLAEDVASVFFELLAQQIGVEMQDGCLVILGWRGHAAFRCQAGRDAHCLGQSPSH